VAVAFFDLGVAGVPGTMPVACQLHPYDQH